MLGVVAASAGREGSLASSVRCAAETALTAGDRAMEREHSLTTSPCHFPARPKLSWASRYAAASLCANCAISALGHGLLLYGAPGTKGTAVACIAVGPIVAILGCILGLIGWIHGRFGWCAMAIVGAHVISFFLLRYLFTLTDVQLDFH